MIMYSNLIQIHELSESGDERSSSSSNQSAGDVGILRFNPEGPGFGEFSLILNKGLSLNEQ